MRTHVYTEEQYPLDEQADESMVPEDGTTFRVLVQWHDVQESPSQAVGRLNAEVGEQAAQAAAEQRAKVLLQKRIDRMAQFVLHRPDTSKPDRTNLVHTPCGRAVAVVADTTFTTPLDTLYERTVGHTCAIDELVRNSVGAVQASARKVRALLSDRSADTVDEGYLVALVDLLWVDLELPPERRRDVAAYLWNENEGDMPWPEED